MYTALSMPICYVRSTKTGNRFIHIAGIENLPICADAKYVLTNFVEVDNHADLDFHSLCSTFHYYPCRRCLRKISSSLEALPDFIKGLKGFIYLAWAVGTSRYKIGLTENAVGRIQQLNSSVSTPYPIRLIHCISSNDMVRHEQHLHNTYSAYRVHKEWFELPPEIIMQIMNLHSFD